MQFSRILLLLSTVSIIGCNGNAYKYVGVYSIAGNEPEPLLFEQRRDAVAIREVFLDVADEIGFAVKEMRPELRNEDDILPGLHTVIPSDGLRAPYDSLLGKRRRVSFSAHFRYPFSIVLVDYQQVAETELMRLIRHRLDSALSTIRPLVRVGFRVVK